jgi:phosphopantothenoylcysteine decarboxylase / phosphopantothenate---cysteine ligase
MQSLLNKKIVLGISGGIAAYKSAELARLLMQEGASVQVVMTEAAQQFVTPVTMQALTGNPVYTSQWDSSIATIQSGRCHPHCACQRRSDGQTFFRLGR